MQKQWLLKEQNPQLQVALSNALSIHPLLAQLLINRDIKTVEEAREFLSADLENLGDPFQFKNMDKAVKRINKAKAHNEKVLVFGDYDVDGVSSSALLYKVLIKMGLEVLNHIPHRMNDGYGLNDTIAPWAKQEGVSLLIAVDCGITAFHEVDTFNQLGLDVIIVDHHEPGEGALPQALAIVNPKQRDCPYPFKYFASVGLVAKLAQALLGRFPEEYLDLVAMGTIADMVPLQGENRTFVKHGLPKINTTDNVGLLALLESSRVKNKKISPYMVGFILGPRLNAMGRMDSAHKSLDLLLSDDKEEAKTLAQLLEAHNVSRQKMQREIVEEAVMLIEQEINFKDERVIVLSKEGWHKGVLGIVASKITEMYYRPSVVISLEGGLGTASARSIAGFHLYNALSHCAPLLEGFGGHEGAAGLKIKEANIDAFKNVINEAFDAQVTETTALIPTLTIDSDLSLSQVTMDFVKMVDLLEPFGQNNPSPVFCSRNLIVKSHPALLGKDTLKFWVSDGEATYSAVGFGMAKFRPLINPGERVDLAYQLSLDDWNKEPVIQLKLKDIKQNQ